MQNQVERSFNLKKLFDKVEEEKPVIEDLSSKPRESFTEKEFRNNWKEFLSQLKKDKNIPAYNALHTVHFNLLEAEKIQFDFSSSSLVTEFELQKDNLMRFMREKLNNYQIEFTVNILENTSQNFVKSSQEKFKDMVELNPLILKMKEEFGLDYNSNE